MSEFTQEEIAELRNAVTLIQKTCSKCDKCKECPFSASEEECLISGTYPAFWKINNPATKVLL
ncbi:hypothetical protein SCB17_003079 [Clostridium perfringens]|nr:hypothetical protein [Clostridium perfringens]